MNVRNAPIRRAALMLAVLLLLVAPVAAQDAAPVDFPTLNALAETDIPPRDRVQLAQALLGVGDIPPRPTSAPERTLGEQATFHVSNASDDRAFNVDATLAAIGDHVYFWVQNGVTIDPNRMEVLAQTFDTYIYPETRALWGSEDTPGIDGDPRIYGLFAHDLGSGTAAYFVSEHVYPQAAVSTSNEHEMFFFNLDALGTSFDQRGLESIVAHEFQHMIRNNLQLNEEYWMNEGFSEFTQLHLFDVPVWETMSFLNMPDTQLNTWAEGSGRARNYGASLLFVTYFYDRYGLDALRALSADGAVRGLQGVDNVLAMLGEPDANHFFADWAAANFLFNPAIEDGQYGYQSIGPNVFSTQPEATVTEYPLTLDGQARQYATDYIVLTNLGDTTALNITLDAPSTVALVPTSAASGQRMWYSNKADVSSTTLTRAFDLSSVSSATLDFNLWYHTERAWDYGYVMASDNGGATWEPLTTQSSTTDNPHNTAYGPGYTGESGGWRQESASLDAYVGGEVLVRFQMITDDAITQPGLAVDDVRVDAIGYSSDFEADDGGWEAAGWVLIDNILPQSAWVQAIQQQGTDATVTRWQTSGAGAWTLPLDPGTEQVVIALSPFAPVTTVPMPYTLSVTPQ
jgi:hypothetical protein